MEVLELIKELLPYILSIIATIVSFRKGTQAKTLEDIESMAEAKKQKYIAKQCKKNKLTDTFHTESAKNVTEVISETNTTDIELLGR